MKKNILPCLMEVSPGTLHLVEASAGTGKTWTIAALIVRLVAEQNIPIERILLITFGKAATAQMRAGVRERLAKALDALGTAPPSDEAQKDVVVAGLRGLGDEAKKRLEEAIRDFDRAPISTIHGFCQRMLTELGVEAGQDPQLSVAADGNDILAGWVADALATTTVELDANEWRVLVENGWSRDNLTRVAKMVTSAGAPLIEPPPRAGAGGRAAIRAALDERPAAWHALREVFGAADVVDFLKALGQVMKENAIVHAGVAKGKPPPTGIQKRLAIKAGGESPEVTVKRWLDPSSKEAGFGLKADAAKLLRDEFLQANWVVACGERIDDLLVPEVRMRVSNAIKRLDDAPGLSSVACAATLADFAQSVRERYPAELARRGLLTYDAMLGNLAHVFEQGGEPADRLAEAIRRLYDVAIVDEFQDTDLAQWTTIRSVFLNAKTRLIAVGDPKQSIYGFRGADVGVYQAAAGHSNEPSGPRANLYSLECNYRSDKPLVDAMNALFEFTVDPPLMGNGAAYVPVTAHTKDHLLTAAEGVAARHPIDFRVFSGAIAGGEPDKWPTKGPATQAIATFCAVECLTLCKAGHYSIAGKALQPGDIAVIVRTHNQAATVQRALRRAGIACVVGGGRGRLEDTPPTEWVLAWLEALADLSHEGAARRVALTPLIGLTPHDIVVAKGANGGVDEATVSRALSDLRLDLGRMAESWKTNSLAFVFNELMRDYDAWPRILATDSGQRDATDLRNLVEGLAADQRRLRLTPSGAAERLRGRRSGEIEDDDGDGDEGGLELETGGNAVRIVTIHSSKGLQYPVVLLPFAWDEPEPKTPRGFLYTKQGTTDPLPRRTLMLGPKDEALNSAWMAAVDDRKAREVEERGRLLYVALTRAKHHVVVFAGRTTKQRVPSLLRLLGIDKDAGSLALADAITARHQKDPTLIGAPKSIDEATAPPGQGSAKTQRPELRTWRSKYDGLGGGWRKSSYTALSKGKDTVARLDFVSSPAAIEDWLKSAPGLDEKAPGATLAQGGKAFGKFVHEVLENLDFVTEKSRTPGDDSLKSLMARLGQKLGVVDEAVHDRVRDLIPLWLKTPLHLDGPNPPKWSLKEGFHLKLLTRKDRRDELRFDLSLGGANGVAVDLKTVDALLDALVASGNSREHGLSDSAVEWVRELRNPSLPDKGGEMPEPRSIVGNIKGILNGSIDLLFKARDSEDKSRYYICDYKTNAIQGPESLRSWVQSTHGGEGAFSDGDARSRNLHFSTPLLGWEMSHHAYHLQSLLYSVAVHRLLCQRLAGYRTAGKAAFEAHFGGHIYPFLRGMGGENALRYGGGALGVWADRWPYEIVHGLDMALRGKERA